MIFGLFEMSCGVLEKSLGVLKMIYEAFEVGFETLEMSYGYQWKNCNVNILFDYFWSIIPAPHLEIQG